MKLSVIFDPEPRRWGFRGDPYFWKYLKRSLGGIDLPLDPGCLERLIRDEHVRLSGKPLLRGGMAHVKAFERGGMTSGGISGDFWLGEAIPLLQERLIRANSNL